MAASLRARTEKLPLIARKDIRDEWEAKKGDFEAQISSTLGEAWSIDLDVNLIYSYADETYNARLGSTITWYIEAFVHNLQRFNEAYGEDGRQELNKTCSEHKLVFGPQFNTNFSYGGLVVKNQKLHLVFADGAYPMNVDDVSRDFAGALATAAASEPNSRALNIIARNSVRQEYDLKIGEVHKKIKQILNLPEIKLGPNFEANARELATSSTDEDWPKRIGFLTLAYFEGFAYALERNKFDNDDMMQEAFAESVDKKEVILRVFQKWNEGDHRYNEVVIEDGILYIQTTTEYFGSNTDDAAMKITDLL